MVDSPINLVEGIFLGYDAGLEEGARTAFVVSVDLAAEVATAFLVCGGGESISGLSSPVKSMHNGSASLDADLVLEYLADSALTGTVP